MRFIPLPPQAGSHRFKIAWALNLLPRSHVSSISLSLSNIKPAVRVYFRFVSLPVDSLRQKLNSQTQNIESEVDKLGQRLLYLETTHKNSRTHIEQMLRTK